MSEIFDISFDKIGVIKNLWEKNRQYHEVSSEYFSETYRYMKILGKGSGAHTSDNKALILRHGRKRARIGPCLGLPDAYALKQVQGNHTPSQHAGTAKGTSSAGPVQRCRECEPVIRHRK